MTLQDGVAVRPEVRLADASRYWIKSCLRLLYLAWSFIGWAMPGRLQQEVTEDAGRRVAGGDIGDAVCRRQDDKQLPAVSTVKYTISFKGVMAVWPHPRS